MFKHAVISIVLLISGVSSGAVRAEQIYAAYEGPSAIKIGGGGTKLEKNGIEYWTVGAPYRPFRILGIFTDARKNRWYDGNAIGSASIAKKVKEVGGNAVILTGSSTENVGIVNFSQSDGSFSGNVSDSGSFSGSSSGYQFGTSQVIKRTTMQLLVVRYLTPEEVAALGDSVPSLSASQASTSSPPSAQNYQHGSQVSAAGGFEPPAKRPAKTPSGFCYDVAKGYTGTGSVNRPITTSATPACYQVE